jgi:hypothetical protein
VTPTAAVEVRIGRAVDGREIVVVLARVVERAQVIQSLGVILGQHLVERVRGLGQQRAFHALGRGLEVVGAVLAHLVEVDLDVGYQRWKYRQIFGARLLLGDRQPVAVQVGEVVVGAPHRERLDMLLVERVGHRR